MKKCIFVTGASGFIGRHASEYFSRKYRVLAPTHRDLDLLDTKQVERYIRTHHVDVVIHTAVTGGSRDQEQKNNQLRDNLRMFHNITRCSFLYTRLIHVGSGAEYDKRYSMQNISEDAFGRSVPIDDYGLYKYTAGRYLEAQTGRKSVHLRVFGVYGPGEDYRLRFISNMMARVLLSKPMQIQKNCMFDYVYIDDVVRIMDICIRTPMKHVSYNIGSGTHRSLVSIAKQIKTVCAPNARISVAQKGMNTAYTCDNSRLMSEIGDFTFSDFDKTLASLYDWYKSRKNRLIL